MNDSVNDGFWSFKRKAIVLSLLFIIIILLFIILLSGVSFFGYRSRTIMIYMAGNNLESEAALATNDLESILPSMVDLDHVNILLYTGSTKKWHNNYINSGENAIFVLEKDGFRKIEVYDRKSLGEIDCFKDFLNYSYQNYSADCYDLIFWNHGAGSLGSIVDEFSDDMLYVTEMRKALLDTPFKDKKLETILFRTCLNSTLEIANELAPYAKYMIASEEITRGSSAGSVLNFLNNINVNDNGVMYGEKFIASYQKQMDNIQESMKISFYAEDIDSTYSIIDLSKISKLVSELDLFFGGIDVSSDYHSIARIRSVLHQYGMDSSNCDYYNTVDLYELVSQLNGFSKYNGDKLLSLIKESVKSNWATNSHSNGISIYMPFYGNDSVKKLHLELYNNLENFSNSYHQFISRFYTMQNSSSSQSFSFVNNKLDVTSDREFSMELTDVQKENFAKAKYIVFQKNDDNYYTPIYSSSDVSLSDDGVLKTKLDNNLLKVYDKDSGDEKYIQAYNIESVNDKMEYTAVGVLQYLPENLSDWKIDSGVIHIKIGDDGVPYISQILNSSDDNITSGRVLNLEDYTVLDFGLFRYRILDDNGNYQEEWESSGDKYLLEVHPGHFEIRRASLDDSDNYYCVFRIIDTKGNKYYSNLMKIK